MKTENEKGFIGYTITGLSAHEFNMIVRALKARSIHFSLKASEKDNQDEFNEIFKLAIRFSELADFVDNQKK